jgi:hypothetical protein
VGVYVLGIYVPTWTSRRTLLVIAAGEPRHDLYGHCPAQNEPSPPRLMAAWEELASYLIYR